MILAYFVFLVGVFLVQQVDVIFMNSARGYFRLAFSFSYFLYEIFRELSECLDVFQNFLKKSGFIHGDHTAVPLFLS